jgi:hypothetical protein
MILARPFQRWRLAAGSLFGAALLAFFLASPDGQAFAAAIVRLFRSEQLSFVATSSARIENAYDALYDLEYLGTRTGSTPNLSAVSSVTQASQVVGFTVRTPDGAALPTRINKTPAVVKASSPRELRITLNKSKADAYYVKEGSSVKMPGNLNGAILIFQFPGISLVEYTGTGGGRVYIGQAGQLTVNVDSNATITQVRDYLLTMPDLDPWTANYLKNMQNWSNTVPLGIPTDKVSWSQTNVAGNYGGAGVGMDDNSGLGAAVMWQRTGQLQFFGVAGVGFKTADVTRVASSLR